MYIPIIFILMQRILLLELISTNAINNDNTLIFKVIGFYNAMDDKESIEGIVSFILNHQ